jgi:hypothetical protein
LPVTRPAVIFHHLSKPKREKVAQGLKELLTSTQILRRRQNRLERIVVMSVIGFIGVVGLAVYFSEGLTVGDLIETIRTVEHQDYKSSKNRAVNCKNPKNHSLPYCQDRLGEIDENWRSIVRHQEGAAPPFGLNGAN